MILLTGGAGFIGSNVLGHLNQKGVTDILVCDNLTNGAKHLNLNNKTFSDYIDKNDLLAQLHNLPVPEYVLHQGACSATTEPNGQYLMKNNYEYSKILLHYCMAKKIPFIYASSASVYGDGKKGFDDAHDGYEPLNGYGYSKIIFDRYVRRLMNEGRISIPVTGLRYFNVYGNGEAHKGDMASVMHKFNGTLQQGRSLQLFEGSDAIFRDFIAVQDVVNVIEFFMGRSNTATGIYNCGTGLQRSFQDIATVFTAHYPQAKVDYIPFPEHLKNKYQYFTLANISALQKAGYRQPFLSLEAGMAAMIDNAAI
jgi:ADP-L-glycero-D-manno-heptose 6-epimerase